ncbi:alpha-2,8-sialyltransferase 8F-like [Neosynchiropus ocellatus]
MKRALLSILCLGSLAGTVSWIMYNNEYKSNYKVPKIKKQAVRPSKFCKGCMRFIDNAVQLYSKTWRWNEQNNSNFRSSLHSQCNGFDNAIITQANSPIGTHITKSHVVTESFYGSIPSEHPFLNKTWDTCAVVGNGGILYDSYCGKEIDSADFVIRCNLPPIGNAYEDHAGTKTSLVTSNPTIFLTLKSQDKLLARVEPFGDSMILIPAFGYLSSLAFKTVRTLKQLSNPSRPVYLNPQYMTNLAEFWRARGVKAARLSSGLIVVSMALEVCKNVHVYGFWPINIHPFGQYYIPHHYYDDTPPKNFHKMPVEFDYLLRLHSEGVIRLHLGTCEK